MLRVANCILTNQNRVLLLKKPRRGWWVAPGGKVESSETVLEAVSREYREETGLVLENPVLSGIFTMCVKRNDVLEKEWMMFTFRAEQFQGEQLERSEEGELCWQPIQSIPQLPTSDMDREIFRQLFSGKSLLIGKLVYTPEEKLLYHTF
ncbi:8-oxo-dGTP diphosphatase [Kroppenstedtia pulmonis]|uniref:8-oxo-dGTP diphosphatase n=1 Tax=Kroppenstedtia pulmonis TaxID=1380685 RepID=A0A7D4C4B6_9BACL|nr:8-oxo-dGTP diphosphatase [Kroppenstedtia pulmonis]QKG83216.1 8-oxo-dGTP diphosphatase [Kroppenstedtia pulmonis]